MFETELQYLAVHRQELFRSYRGRVLLIRGQQLEGVFPSMRDAYLAAERLFPNDAYVLQLCEEDAVPITHATVPLE